MKEFTKHLFHQLYHSETKIEKETKKKKTKMRRKDAGCTTFARQKFLFFSYTLFFSFLFFFPFISALSFTSGYTRQSRGYRVRFIVFSPACDDLNLILGLLSVFVYIIYIMCAYVCLYVYYTRARGSLKS